MCVHVGVEVGVSGCGGGCVCVLWDHSRCAKHQGHAHTNPGTTYIDGAAHDDHGHAVEERAPEDAVLLA